MKHRYGIPVLESVATHLLEEEGHIDSECRLFFDKQIDLRAFVEKVNSTRDTTYNSKLTMKAGELNAVMILSGVIGNIVSMYAQNSTSNIFEDAHGFLLDKSGEKELDILRKNYKTKFLSPKDSNFLAETLLVWLLNRNTAISNYCELFDEQELKPGNSYPKQMELLREFFRDQPAPQDGGLDLISFLLEPSEKFPDSILDQLKFIATKWREFFDDDLLAILQALDLLKEESKSGLTGPGPAHLLQFSDEEYENFTADKEWMPRLVLLAKSTYVWMDQLARKYKCEVTRLDQIPDEELRLQSSRGITGIWLIGVWQRSAASKRIKEIAGDGDAIASAYSLDDYSVARDMGGDDALEGLKRKAAAFGIRIGCDMVPNHTGIDSKWIVEHPEWFIQLDSPPFPAYSFTGENLSQKEEIQVYLEDHYYDRTDAAVVFKHINSANGQTRYIYHGNDGTSTPWNDTAQLNYLLPEVRKAVSDQIVEIARKFPVIRFDAAMTLAKKHIQRLWFPEPGSGGDIATRSEHGLSRAEFEKRIPVEFWREIVDRIQVEAPDTLLLAEAFWMMEGFFLRTLGMHRVYNSAFMKMLAAEENAKYRQSIFNVLEFNPQILKRFVNFMSNPDEDTAIAQFGKDDKYFGICILMSTMPGLPMLAHGQVEGFSERYGMEYSRAKWDEKEDNALIDRHNREIFPLLNKRPLFSDVENFALFDFDTENGEVNENVFAYTNEFENAHSLVVYNNKYERTSGRIRMASVPTRQNEETVWTRRNLADAWRLSNDPNRYVIFRDIISGLQFVRNSAEIHEHGLYQHLDAFKYAVYLDVHEVTDSADGHYRKLAEYLQGGGTEDVAQSLQRIALMPLLEAFAEYMHPDAVALLTDTLNIETFNRFKNEMAVRIEEFLRTLNKWMDKDTAIDDVLESILADFALFFTHKFSKYSKEDRLFTVIWILLRHLGVIESGDGYEKVSANWLNELFFSDRVGAVLESVGFTENIVETIAMLKAVLMFQNLWQSVSEESVQSNSEVLKTLMVSDACFECLGINEYDNIQWYNLEAFERFFDLLEMVNLIASAADEKGSRKLNLFFKTVRNAADKSKCQVDRLIGEIQND